MSKTRKTRKLRKLRKLRVGRVLLLITFVLLIVVGSNLLKGLKNSDSDLVSSVKNGAIHIVQQVFDAQPKPQALDWKLVLVNEKNPLPQDFSVSLRILKDGYKIDRRIYDDLEKMFTAARLAGVYPQIVEAYRTDEQQQQLLVAKTEAYIYDGASEKQAKALAKTWVATPGTSEHQLGLALDINADKSKSTNEEVYQWLAANSYEYGFILRYPVAKAKITGVNHEPWHYRYVGAAAAKTIYEQGVCFEEYLENLAATEAMGATEATAN